MDRIVAAEVFVRIAERGSMTAAAAALDMSRAMVTRYLAQMEQWAGARLLHRTTRRLSLTEAGEETLARCRRMLEVAAEMASAASACAEEPRGLLRVACAQSLAQDVLASAVADYLRRHPRAAIDLHIDARPVNLVEERIDLAIRITNDLDPNLIARRLTVCRSVVCASAAYLRERSAPRRVEDLGLHNCLTHSYHGKSLWEFERQGEPVTVAVSGNISANDSTSIVQAALCGAGVAMLPTFLAAPLIREDRLVALLPEVKPRELSIHAVYASRKHMSAALRTMLDFLAQQFAPEPAWDNAA